MIRKRAILTGWTVVFVVSAGATFVNFSSLSRENINIIISIAFFTAAILVVIFWIVISDYMPWPFSLIYKKIKTGKIKDS